MSGVRDFLHNNKGHAIGYWQANDTFSINQNFFPLFSLSRWQYLDSNPLFHKIMNRVFYHCALGHNQERKTYPSSKE